MTPQQYQAIADLYALLSRLWLSEIDEPLLNRLSQSELAASFGLKTSEAAVDESLEALAVDYCQLLIGPVGHLPPYQSIWQFGELKSQPAESSNAFADMFGVSNSKNVMADHLGFQLMIMSYVNRSLANDPSQSETLKAGKEFFARHLTWPAKLTAAVAKRAGTDFYQALAALTNDLLESETEYWT